MEPARVRTVVCDDEPDGREGLVARLRQDTDVAVVATACTGLESVDVIEKTAPDLAFLDVQMPMLDGFEVIRRVGLHNAPLVVFVTAHDEYALRAFEVHALDYLLKPFSDARFSEMLVRAKAAARQRRAGALSEKLMAVLDASRRAGQGNRRPSDADDEKLTRKYLDRIFARQAGVVALLPVEEVDWIEAGDNCVKLHSAARIYVVRETMAQLEVELDPRHFVRVHPSVIVRMGCVRALEPRRKGDHVLVLRDDTCLPLSRDRRSGFEVALSCVDSRDAASHERFSSQRDHSTICDSRAGS